jgi:P-type E1-E2 ATPase
VIQPAVSEFISESGDLAAQALGAPPRIVWAVRENVEVQTPFTHLQPGDVIVVSRGEFIPVDGVITAGKATVTLLLRSGTSTPLSVGEGDRVYARTFVTEGRIRVQIE